MGIQMRHGIEPAGVEGMAAAQPTEQEAPADKRPMVLQRFHGILGATGIETALARKAPTNKLIAPDRAHQQAGDRPETIRPLRGFHAPNIIP